MYEDDVNTTTSLYLIRYKNFIYSFQVCSNLPREYMLYNGNNIVRCLNKSNYHILHKDFSVLHMFEYLYLFSVIADINLSKFYKFSFSRKTLHTTFKTFNRILLYSHFQKQKNRNSFL